MTTMTYEITRTPDGAHDEHTYDLVAQTPFGRISGTMVIDTDGHLLSVVERASYGELKIERSSPPR